MADITVKLPNLANQTAIVNALNKIAQQTLDVRSLVSQAVKDNWKTIYPVGSIYISVNSTSPASLFGGSWEQIQDRFLLAAGPTYSAGKTGGEAAHTLTIDEMPTHGHDSYDYTAGFMAHKSAMSGEWIKDQILATISAGAGVVWTHQNPPKTGGGGSHNNMPPYLSVYMWKRVS